MAGGPVNPCLGLLRTLSPHAQRFPNNHELQTDQLHLMKVCLRNVEVAIKHSGLERMFLQQLQANASTLSFEISFRKGWIDPARQQLGVDGVTWQSHWIPNSFQHNHQIHLNGLRHDRISSGAMALQVSVAFPSQ